jgi:hypothetical protein
MTLQRACSFVLVVLTAVVLSGCFVVSKNLPKGEGPIADERLIGAWRGFDKDDQKDAEAFLHFLKPDRGEPLKLVWVEDRNYQVYEVRTMVIAGKNVFAAKLLTPLLDAKRDEMPDGYYLGYYEMNGDEVSFNLLEAEKIGELIKAGKVKGTAPLKKYDFATLTGSPAELAAFLASPEAQAAAAEDPAIIHRLR